MIPHLLKKDIRRSRVPLAMWALLIIAQSVLAASGMNPADRAMQAGLQIIAALVPIFQILLLVVIIPHVIHEEPLVGTTAFWFTRPISPAQLLKSKALFASLILVLVPLLTELIVFAANGVTARDIALAAPEIVMNQLALILTVAVLACITPNFGRFAVVGAGYLIGMMLANMAWQWAKIFRSPETFLMGNGVSASLAQSRSVAGTLATILVAGGVVAHQYLTRRTARSVAAAVIGTAAVMATQNGWPIDFLKPAPADNAKAGFDIAAVKISISHAPSVSDFSTGRGNQPPNKSVQAEWNISGLPPGMMAEINRVESKFTPQGQPASVQSAQSVPNNAFSSDLDGDALASALGGIPVLNVNPRQMNISAPLLLFTADQHQKYQPLTLALEANVSLRVSRFQIAGEMPLQKGVRFDKGSEHSVLTEVLKQSDGVEIVLQERKVNLLFEGKQGRQMPFRRQLQTVYLLVNRNRREAIQQKNLNTFQMNIFGQSRFTNQPVRLAFGPDSNRSRLLPEINDAWLADAVLVRLERVPVAEFAVPYVDPDFSLNRDLWNKKHKNTASHGSRVDKDTLDHIQLPPNPSQQQVKDYVFAILAASQKQNGFSDRDPQIDMLAKVGPENIGVLFEFGDRLQNGPAYYLWETVKRLARPEDKEAILKALSAHRELIDVVVKYGWVADAKETLMSALSSEKGFLPRAWIKAIASLQDPETYPALEKHFVRSNVNKKEIFEAIKELPGIDLSETVAEAWKRAKFQGENEMLEMCPVAAEYGNIEAIDAAAKFLKGGSKNHSHRKLASETLRKFTPATGDDRALIAWYDANRANLGFDPATRKFVPKPQ